MIVRPPNAAPPPNIAPPPPAEDTPELTETITVVETTAADVFKTLRRPYRADISL